MTIESFWSLGSIDGPLFGPFADASFAVEATGVLLAVACLIGSVERFAAILRDPTAGIPEEVLAAIGFETGPPRPELCHAVYFGSSTVFAGMGATSFLVLVFAWLDWSIGPLCLALAGISYFWLERYGPALGTVAPTFRFRLFLAVGLGTTVPGTKYLLPATALLVAATCLWSYFAAGFNKLVARGWRDGRALLRTVHYQRFLPPILRERLEGQPWLIRRARLVGYLVIATELVLPLMLVAWPRAAFLLLLCGAVFHLLNWTFLSLREFTTTWIATYPCLLWLASTLDRSYGS